MQDLSPITKKSFKDYLREGLMIFVAVTLGFFAESLRESLNNKDQERDYIKSFINNLAQDTTRLTISIKENQRKISVLDSLLFLSHNSVSDARTKRLLYKYSPMIAFYSLFVSNDATMLQLKNGGLQYIKRSHIADSIALYDQIVRGIYIAEIPYLSATTEITNAMAEILIFKIRSDTAYFKNGDHTGKDLPLLSADPAKIEIFFNKISLARGWTQNYINHLQGKLPYTHRLIELLKKEYDFSKEDIK